MFASHSYSSKTCFCSAVDIIEPLRIISVSGVGPVFADRVSILPVSFPPRAPKLPATDRTRQPSLV